MKKKIALIVSAVLALATTLVCVVTCKSGKNGEDDFNKLVTPYSSSELEQILVTDNQKMVTVEVSENTYLSNLLETVTYYEVDQTQADLSANQLGYVITLDTIEINVYSPSLVEFVYADETTEFACVKNNEFGYMNSVVESGAVCLEGYSIEQTVSVKNANGGTAENMDKEWFLDELGGLFFVKLGNASHYDLGSFAYTVTIGSDTILVYQNYVTVNGSLYRLHEGSFDFFYELDFGTSSGWLPWL